MASRTEVLPAPLGPVSRLSAGSGANETVSKRRRPLMSSRVIRINLPQSRTPGPGRAFLRVPRGTEAGSQAERHHHMAALLAPCLANERGGVGVAQLEDDVLVAQGGEGIQQVVHVEADRQ